MATNYILGKDAVLYYSGTALTGENSATVLSGATEAGNVKDVTLNLTKDESDITCREDSGWKVTVGTLKDAEISFSMKWKPGDTFFTAVKNAYINNTEITLFVMSEDKTVVTSEGFCANFNIFSFTRNENLTEAVMVDISAKPSSYPEWYVAGGNS